MRWFYQKIENEKKPIFEVGYYDPSGDWHKDSRWNNSEDAAIRVAWLNGASYRAFFGMKTLENRID